MHITKPKSYFKLIESARNLFSTKWYEIVSVAEICRNAGLSNGIFYRYFKNKKELFLTLLNEIVIYYEKSFASITGDTFDERLDKFLDVIVSTGVGDYKKDILIYREGQYRFPEYEHHLRNLYTIGISNVCKRETTQAEQLFVSGIVRFVTIRYIFNSLTYNKEKLKKLIVEGIFEEEIKNFDLIFDNKNVVYPELFDDDSTKSKLINSGIKLFGEKGFHKTDIHDISKDAGYSVGTFYIYFNSKETFLSEIVKLIGKQTRRFLSVNLSKDLTRAENEIRGIYLFLKFFEKNSEFYEIVRESEFVVRETANEYYNAFERGYINNLKNIKLNDKKLVANSLMGISHYTGIEKIFLKKMNNEKMILKELSYYLNYGISR